MSEDLYKTLGVSREASDQEIKKSYRRLAQKFHPDRNKGNKDAEARFKEINNAYEILSDKQKRGVYDQFGTTTGGADFGGGFGGQGFDFSSFGSSFSDIFETFFGNASDSRSGGRRPGRQQRGNDIESMIQLKFEEAVFGTEKTLEVSKATVCDHCHGNGAEPGSKIISCPTCHGTGEIRSVQHTILGQIATSRACSSCNGEGKIPQQTCNRCQGTTRIRKTEKITIKIPAGIEDRATIRVKDKGEAGMKNGHFGDLYLHIAVLPHKEFTRKGYDIYSERELDVLQAILGDTIPINTVHGETLLEITPGTVSGALFKMKNKGVPNFQTGETGDHVVKAHISIPKRLGKREKELYEEIAKERGLKLNSPKKGWLF